MDENDVNENVEIIIENDKRVHIRWNLVLGKPLSAIITDELVRNENRTCQEIYEVIQPSAFEKIENFPNYIPALLHGTPVFVNKDIAKRNFDLTFSSVYSTLTSFTRKKNKVI